MHQTNRAGNPIPFDLEYVTANQKTGDAGDVKSALQFVKLNPKTINATKSANHFMNSTINIMPAGGGPITKVHVMLIRKFNNQTVS